jgi:hypothetical protein
VNVSVDLGEGPVLMSRGKHAWSARTRGVEILAPGDWIEPDRERLELLRRALDKIESVRAGAAKYLDNADIDRTLFSSGVRWLLVSLSAAQASGPKYFGDPILAGEVRRVFHDGGRRLRMVDRQIARDWGRF